MPSSKSGRKSKTSQKCITKKKVPKSPKKKTKKPHLAFGYGYDPEQLRDGIKSY